MIYRGTFSGNQGLPARGVERAHTEEAAAALGGVMIDRSNSDIGNLQRIYLLVCATRFPRQLQTLNEAELLQWVAGCKILSVVLGLSSGDRAVCPRGFKGSK